MTPQTKEILLGQLRTWAAGAGLSVATLAASHGFINGASAVSIGGIIAGVIVTGVCALYSLWDKYGRDIIHAQLEVLKAKSLAQAAKINAAGLPPVTVNQIAAQSPTMTPADVTKAVATLPPAIQANVAKVAAAAMVAFIVALTPIAPASAQTKKKLPIPLPTVNLPIDPLGLNTKLNPQAVTGLPADIQAEIAKIVTFFANTAASDIDQAITMSTQFPELTDNVGAACWTRFKPITALVQAYPNPLSLTVASDIEKLRLFTMAIKNLCNDPACTQVWGDLANTATAVSPTPIPIPSISAFCAKVPGIGSTLSTAAIVPAAQSPPAPTPIPAPGK